MYESLNRSHLLTKNHFTINKLWCVDVVNEALGIIQSRVEPAVFDPLPLVPSLLKSSSNWVTYESKDSKAPIISGTTRSAKSNDPSTWVSYDVACRNISDGKGYSGLGFVTDGVNSQNLVGFDLDGCRNPETGDLTAWAARLKEVLGATYGEVTVSGTGLRFWVVAEFPKSMKFKMGFAPLYNGKNQKLEIFGDGLYFTMSGNKLPDLPSEVATLDAVKLKEVLSLAQSLAVEEKKLEKSALGAFAPQPDEGFQKLLEAIGWTPLIDRMNKMSDTRFHGLSVEPGQMVYCPMPGHQPRGTHLNYTPCFGALKDEPALVHCFGCDFSGDMVKSVFEFDAGEDGGHIRYKNMYDCARAICTENGLNFEEFFPQAATSSPAQSTAQQPTGTTNELIARRVSSYTKKKIDWLWPGRIPFRSLTTLAGDPDQGKSLVSLYVAACITRGVPFYGGTEVTVPASEVLMLAAEDDAESTLRPRLEAAGADVDKVILLDSVLVKDGAGKTTSERLAQLDADLERIMALLNDNPAIRLVIIDPISSFLGDVPMNREQEVRRVLNPLLKEAQKRKIAVMLIAHFNKNSETRSAIDRVGGAKALVGLGRAAWVCTKEPKPTEHVEGIRGGGEQSMAVEDLERRMFLKLKGNLTPSSIGGLLYTIRTKPIEVENDRGGLEFADTPYVVWLEKTDSNAQDVVIDGKPVAQRQSDAEAGLTWLRGYLEQSGGSAWSQNVYEVGDQYGYGKRTLQRNLGRLKGKVVYVGKQTQWVIPGAQLQPEATAPPTKFARTGRRKVTLNKVAVDVEPEAVNRC